jgi:hypothetical protein
VENVVHVSLSSGKAVAIIDADDAERVLAYKWSLSVCNSGLQYAQHREPKSKGAKLTKLHRFIMGVTDSSKCVDHINGNTLDNRKCNLRVCNQGENMRNYRRAWGKEGIRGVMKTRTGKYRARIRYQNKLHHIGTFDTQRDASVAYAFASSLLHGDFGSLPGHEKFLASAEDE